MCLKKMNSYPEADLRIFFECIQKKIDQEKENLSSLLDSLESYYAELSCCADVMDRANLSFGVDSILAQICRTKKFLSDLERAKTRIKNRTYGVCQYTGELIPKERLLVNPVASCVVEVKRNPVAS